jgi:tight adherence protein C
MFGIADIITDPQTIITILVAVSVFATIVTLAGSFVGGSNDLDNRMKSVALERDKMRAQNLERLSKEKKAASLRQQSAKGYMSGIVQGLNLRKALETEETRAKLKMAGLRTQGYVITFLFFRVALPIVFAAAAFIYLNFINDFKQPFMIKLLIVIGGAYVGFFGPNIFISNMIAKRKEQIKASFSDALDLLLICVESGMSIEAAFNKVAEEIGTASPILAEEMSLTTAELSYLPDRRQAYENFGKRTGLLSIKSVATSLIQAERYGTPLANSLRVLAQENRDMRMAEAERKAAGLPPKLTVPMILFFLPVIFVVILGPAIIKLMKM